MKTKLSLLLLVTWTAHAATTINPVNKFACGVNLGWMDWRGADFVFGIGR